MRPEAPKAQSLVPVPPLEGRLANALLGPPVGGFLVFKLLSWKTDKKQHISLN